MEVPQLSTREQQRNSFAKNWKKLIPVFLCSVSVWVFKGTNSGTATCVILALDLIIFYWSFSTICSYWMRLGWPVLLFIGWNFYLSCKIYRSYRTFGWNSSVLIIWSFSDWSSSLILHLQAAPWRSPSQWAMQESCMRSGWNWETAASAALSST